MEKENNDNGLEINPITKFKYLIKGSATARNLSFVYVLISLLFLYKMRDEIAYAIPLIFGAILIIWYTVTYLLLKNINLKKNDLINQFELYKSQTLKREKYESIVYFIWILTLIPAFLYGQEITILTLIKWMVITYLFFIFGSTLFKNLKTKIIDLEKEIYSIEGTNFC